MDRIEKALQLLMNKNIKQPLASQLAKCPGAPCTTKLSGQRASCEHYQILHHPEEPQNEDKATNVGEQQETAVRLLPSRELNQPQGHFAQNSDRCCRTQLSHPV